jgi:hypothetical protein
VPRRRRLSAGVVTAALGSAISRTSTMRQERVEIIPCGLTTMPNVRTCRKVCIWSQRAADRQHHMILDGRVHQAGILIAQ